VKIGIDATCWWNNRGFGRYTREMLTALFQLDTQHHFTLFIDQPIEDLSRFANVEIIEVGSSRPTTEAAVADSSRSVLDMFRLYRAVASTRLDLMYFPAVYSWFPVPNRLPMMLTVMDAIAEHYPKLIFSSWRSRFFCCVQCIPGNQITTLADHLPTVVCPLQIQNATLNLLPAGVAK